MEWTPIVGCAYDATISVSAESENVVTLTIQFLDYAGNALTEACSVQAFNATSAGAYVVGTYDTDFAASTGTIAVTLTKGCYQIVSDATGAVVLTVGDTSTNSGYLAIVLPNGKRVLSDVITLT